MNQDARSVLNLKNRQKQYRNLNASEKIVDARQIIKLKRSKNSQPRFKSNQFFQRSNQISTGMAKKPLNVLLKQQIKGNTRRLQNNDSKGFKQVQLAKDGLRVSKMVMSNHQNDSPNVVLTGATKRVFSVGTELTVTARNKPARVEKPPVVQKMEDDDLESMTLDDLPEIHNIKSLPRGLLSPAQHAQWLESRAQSSLARRLENMENTMVADTEKSPDFYTPQSHKIVVTNLHSSVTEGDILELFGDVGAMKSSHLLHPGTALIEYFNREDASQACETYHNRLLDGQPMQCVMQTSASAKRSISSRLGGKYVNSSSMVHSQQQLSTSLFPHTSSYRHPQPITAPKRGNRSVQFTVKLP